MINTILENYITTIEALFTAYKFIYEERLNRKLSLPELSEQLVQVRQISKSLYDILGDPKIEAALDKVPEDLYERLDNSVVTLKKVEAAFEREYQNQRLNEDHVPVKYQQLVPYNSPKAEA